MKMNQFLRILEGYVLVCGVTERVVAIFTHIEDAFAEALPRDLVIPSPILFDDSIGEIVDWEEATFTTLN